MECHIHKSTEDADCFARISLLLPYFTSAAIEILQWITCEYNKRYLLEFTSIPARGFCHLARIDGNGNRISGIIHIECSSGVSQTGEIMKIHHYFNSLSMRNEKKTTRFAVHTQKIKVIHIVSPRKQIKPPHTLTNQTNKILKILRTDSREINLKMNQHCEWIWQIKSVECL